MIFLFSENRSLLKVLVQSPLEMLYIFDIYILWQRVPQVYGLSLSFMGDQPMGLKPNRVLLLLASPNGPCSFIGEHAG